MKKLLPLLLSFSISAHASDLILSGKIVSGASQYFEAPFISSNNIQLEWMTKEGETVSKGDLIVVFNTSDLVSEIEQQKSNLRTIQEQTKEKLLILEQGVITAEHDLAQLDLKQKLAALEAEIPAGFRSKYEYESTQYDLNKANKLLELAKTNLAGKKQELSAEGDKQQLEIKRIEIVLTKKETDLSRLHLYANQDGTVLHGMNPWLGTKITSGQIVDIQWRVASIVSRAGSKVQAWVNEVDLPKVHQQQSVRLAVDAYPAISFSGTIEKVFQQAEKKKDWGNASYYELDIRIDEPPSIDLIPGMSVQVSVIGHINQALALGIKE
ncbi:MAG: HlyD family efflux transporter periplasmic adaptor subunit [Gammaproteobacteria bacterium]|nr:HlyD family efflux transporter periplasmic adaptor subunit [Gammaproteobacteria bacterium]